MHMVCFSALFFWYADMAHIWLRRCLIRVWSDDWLNKAWCVLRADPNETLSGGGSIHPHAWAAKVMILYISYLVLRLLSLGRKRRTLQPWLKDGDWGEWCIEGKGRSKTKKMDENRLKESLAQERAFALNWVIEADSEKELVKKTGTRGRPELGGGGFGVGGVSSPPFSSTFIWLLCVTQHS